MSKTDIKEIVDKLGVRADQLADDIEERIDEWKDSLDAETRRAVRPYWICITAISFVLGCGVGHFFL